jgi:hypothetical protein
VTHRPSTIARGVELARRAFPRHHRLRVLVIGDPDARICRAMSAGGATVGCCPDLQAGWQGASLHVDVLTTTAQRLLEQDRRWDLVIAVDGWSRVLASNPPSAVEALIEWMRLHAETVLVEAPRRVLAPDLNELGPYDVQRLLGGFAFMAEVIADSETRVRETPLILASDHGLLVDQEWIPADRVEWVDRFASDALVKPVRTFRAPGGRIVKVECSSEDYFERSQVLREAAFLAESDEGRRADLDLPRVRTLMHGRAVVTMARDEVPGGSGDHLATDAQIAGLLAAADRYARRGLFHNDVRQWNLVWEGDRARFIDYADTSHEDEDVRGLPQVLALAGVVAGIATGEFQHRERFHVDVLEVASRAGLLDRWPLAHQFGNPWLAISRVRPGHDVRPEMTAGELMTGMLGAILG